MILQIEIFSNEVINVRLPSGESGEARDCGNEVNLQATLVDSEYSVICLCKLVAASSRVGPVTACRGHSQTQ